MATASIFQMAALFKLAHYQIARKEASLGGSRSAPIGTQLTLAFSLLHQSARRDLVGSRLGAETQPASEAGRRLSEKAVPGPDRGDFVVFQPPFVQQLLGEFFDEFEFQEGRHSARVPHEFFVIFLGPAAVRLSNADSFIWYDVRHHRTPL